MPVRVNCPHCRTPCLVGEQHLGVPVQCGRCARTFTTAPAAPPPVRFDIGAAGASGAERFLVRQMAWCNRDERHELAVLLIASAPALRDAVVALTPLFRQMMEGARGNAAAPAGAIVLRDGEIILGKPGDCRVYHRRGSQFTPLASSQKLAAGDWLIVGRGTLDAAKVQTEIGKNPSSAFHLARQLAAISQRAVVAVRCL